MNKIQTDCVSTSMSQVCCTLLCFSETNIGFVSHIHHRTIYIVVNIIHLNSFVHIWLPGEMTEILDLHVLF